jgi:3-methylcrotonyl-CoA carboxylase alpha subunit
MKINALLIANRGEIACRIIRTARELGIRTIAVYSDADANGLHVRAADTSVHIGPSPARESYLVGERIIEAALASGADAVHPGYGFLSENAEFADAVIAGGLIWVGPKSASIRAMGLKDAAKALMAKAGVAVTPGYHGAEQSLERLHGEADSIGYPVLIKAVAGGGGKGMRKVDDAATFPELLRSCQREAIASFGDERVLIEKYIQRPRHIEVQVFGDTHGNVVHLFERDCSLQRRHQKVIEEAPAPGMDATTREWVCSAAVKAAQAVDYVGAGTIEFIADASEGLRSDRIWFMEMNTRLQVEHPVTEAITGQDLVEWQLRVAAGERLPLLQADLRIEGHAIEARLYAEDPTSGFLPSIGRLERFELPGKRIRIDSGVTRGSEISPFYDPMIAKLISWNVNRRTAAAVLAEAARDVQIWPVKTNAAFLARALEDPDFLAGNIDTGFIERHGARLVPLADPPADVMTAAALAVTRELAATLPGGSAWREASGFRINAPPAASAVQLKYDSRLFTVILGAAETPLRQLDVISWKNGVLVFADGQSWYLEFARAGISDAGAGASNGMILSPMPGRIIATEVAEGSHVIKGQKLIVLEAMKMEHAMHAQFDGVVSELKVVVGAQVAEGVVLLRITKPVEGGA